MFSASLYREFFFQSPDLLAVINRDFRIEMCNWRGGYEYVPEERRRSGAHCYELFYPGRDGPCPDCHVVEVFREGKPVVREKFNPRIGYVEAHCFPIFDDKGEVVLVAEQVRNISIRKQAETDLRDQVNFLQTLMDAIPLPVFHKDNKGFFRGCNKAFTEYFDLAEQEIIGRSVYDIAPKELADVYHEAEQELVRCGGTQVYRSGLVAADGRLHAVVFTNATFVDQDGRLSGLVGTILDITEQKETMDRLRESEERYRQLFEEALTGNFIGTVDGRLVACNPAFARIFDLDSVEEALRLDLRDLYVDPEERLAMLERLRRDRKIEHQVLEMRTPGGRNLSVILTAIGIFDLKGELVELRGHIRDDTERRSLQEQLGHVQKMEAVGRLAGGLAHDFNNLLTVVIGYSEFLLQQLRDPHLIQCARQLLDAGDRASNLTRQLLAFGRRQKLHLEVIDLRVVLSGLTGMLQSLAGKNVQLDILAHDAVGRIRADQSQIEQVVVNLVVNARDAMPEGGRLTLSLADVRLNTSLICGPFAVKAGDYVLLTVSDTGVGIGSDALPHIFEPFFTTKEKGKGTGLGLASVYGIVTQSGGGIGVDSTPGQGTVFRIYLPLVDSEGERNRASDPDGAELGEIKPEGTAGFSTSG
jgi:two-component system cell cycle sensor histidine kinase/response regulator CckA